MVLTVAFIVWKTIFLDQFLVETPVSGVIHLWVDGQHDEAALIEKQREMLQSSTCLQPSTLDYAWSPDWLYVNSTCACLCADVAADPACPPSDECIHADDMLTQTHGRVLFVTYSQRTKVHPGDSIATSRQKQHGVLVPFVESLSLGMSITRVFNLDGAGGPGDNDDDEDGAALREAVVILRQDGE